MATRITTKTQYAVAAMLELAQSGESSSIAVISSKQSINPEYMSIILSELKRKNLVLSTRGPKGGYKIAHPIDTIAISDIMDAVGEKIKVTRCDGKDNNCTGSNKKCSAHNMWQKLEDNIGSYLSSVTLNDLLKAEVSLDELTKCNHFSIRSI